MSTRQRRADRSRVGRVSVYLHHGTWWLYYREHGKQVRRKVSSQRREAEQLAAQVNSQLATGAPCMLAFEPVSVGALRREFIDYHEHVLQSAVATVRRYRAATKHLEDYFGDAKAHEIRADRFAAYLRSIEVSPNGHPHTRRRKLRHKGVQFILECCRAMYAFAGRRRHLPAYSANPFQVLPIAQLKIEDSKPIFVFDAETERQFFEAVTETWDYPIHFVLAKTGLRIGELVHLLIEEVDLSAGWLSVRNKAALGWRIKTGTERRVPLLEEVVAVLRRVIGARSAGPVFLREKFASEVTPPLVGARGELERVCDERVASGIAIDRFEILRVARGVWRDAGAVKADTVRTSFMRITKLIGHPEATCPKSWRHTFATLLQDANVDPLIRQLTLGHRPTSEGGLGMTAHYTHTRPETHRMQIEQALRRWPKSLELALQWAQGGSR